MFLGFYGDLDMFVLLKKRSQGLCGFIRLAKCLLGLDGFFFRVCTVAVFYGHIDQSSS